MADIVFPIAISSELDVTGEERIHMANWFIPSPRPIFTGLSQAILLDAPILYWKLNELTGEMVIDYSGYDRHGVYVGTEGVHYERTSSGIKMLGIALYPTQSGVKSPVDPDLQVAKLSHNWSMLLLAARHGNPAGVSGNAYEPLGGIWGNSAPPRNGHLQYTLNYTVSEDGEPRGRARAEYHNSVHNSYGVIDTVGVVNDTLHIFHLVGSDEAGSQRITLYKDGAFVGEDLANALFTEDDATAYFSVGGAMLETAISPFWSVFATISHAAVFAHTLSPTRVLAHAQAAGLT